MNKYIQMDLEEKEHFHVLAVDDSHIDRKLLERLLTVFSYQVTIVDSGDKALEFLGLLDIEQNECESSLLTSSVSTTKSSHEQDQKMKVNLIMTDYSMPGISGYDLLKRVKDSSWKDIPVVVMSSENIQSRINMCLEGGAEEFLLKPVKLSDLKKIHNSITYQNNYKSSVVCNGAKTNIDKDKITGCNSNKRKAATNVLSSALFDRKPRVVEELMPVS